jgi:hypothetical protein
MNHWSGGFGHPPAVLPEQLSPARSGRIPCNQAGIWELSSKTGMAGKLSKSPWPLIRKLHHDRFGPRNP